jgi:hypothetical protein
VFRRGSIIDYGKAFRPCTGDGAVTEDEVEVVAEELAKAGGTSWYGSVANLLFQSFSYWGGGLSGGGIGVQGPAF